MPLLIIGLLNFVLQSSSATGSGAVVDDLPGGYITGIVTDAATGRPLAGVIVSAGSREANPRAKNSTKTDKDGRYRINGLGDGTYILQPQPIDGFRPEINAERARVAIIHADRHEDVNLAMRDTPRIRGRVLDEQDQPIAGLRVEAGVVRKGEEYGTVGSDGRYSFTTGNPFVREYATTGSDGRFALKGFRPTDKLWVWIDNVGNHPCVAPLRPLTLTDQGLDGLTLKAQRPGSVSGVITEATGDSFEGFMVSLYRKDFPFWNQGAKSNARGEFHISRVIPGEYTVGFPGAGPKCVVGPGETLTGLAVTGTRLDHLETLSISGAVRNEHGDSVAEIDVSAWAGISVGRPPRPYPTNAEGRYCIKELHKGEYLIKVTDPLGRYQENVRRSVSAGSTDVDFVLKQASTLEGQVLRADGGQPLTDFEIDYTTSEGGFLNSERSPKPFTAIHDEQGRFKRSLSLNRTVDWTIKARAPGFATEVLCLPQVAPDKSLKDLTIRLRRGGTITGVVLGPNGKPVPEVFIYAGKRDFTKGDVPGPLAITQYDGTFKLLDCAPETQTLTASHPRFAPAAVEVTPKSDESVSIEIRLTQKASP